MKKQPGASWHIKDSIRQSFSTVNRIENSEREFRTLMRKIDMASQPAYKAFLRWLYDEIAVILIRTGVTFLLLVAHLIAIVLGVAILFMFIVFLIEH